MTKFYENFKFSIESVTPFPAPPEHLFGTFALANATLLALFKALEEIRKASGGRLPATFGQICNVAKVGASSAWLLIKSGSTMTVQGQALNTTMVIRAGTTVAACGAAWYVGALAGAVVYAAVAETVVMQNVEKGIVKGTAPFWDWWYGTNDRNADTARMEMEMARRGHINHIKKLNENLINKERRYYVARP